MHDPAYPESLPAAPLVRYTYTEAGELLAVYDRNTQGALSRMTRSTRPDGGAPLRGKAGDALPLRRYGRVVEQLNPAGLSYRYLYEQDRITVTDSLNRREVLLQKAGPG